MPSIQPGYEYDIFISYRHNDNLDGWVAGFVQNLERELRGTLKEPLSIYFDTNPHDGLGDHHDVDDSLREKLKCLIFIPIVSRTYCDTNSFAWNNEFKVFVNQANSDSLGAKVKLASGNVASRVLPIRIHELNTEDVSLFESQMGGKMRSIDFIYKESGVNRPLQPSDNRSDNLVKMDYRNQMNKVANAIEEVISGIKNTQNSSTDKKSTQLEETSEKLPFKKELKRRNVIRASSAYILFALLVWKVLNITADLLHLNDNTIQIITLVLVILFPISMLMAWLYERSPEGFIRTGSVAALNNPFSDEQKKPLTSNTFIGLLLVTTIALFFLFPKSYSGKSGAVGDLEKSIAVLPFANLSNDPDQQFFADGVMEDILTQLQRMNELKVTSKTSVEQYRSTTKRVTDIGDELGVSYLLEGSVRKSDDQIMITAQLIRTGDDSHMWADNFTSEYSTKGLFEIQRQIAENIVQELSLKISPIKMKAITQEQTTNKEAYEHFQRGRQLYDQYNRTSNELSIEQFKLAIRKDPKYASPHGGLANALMQRVIYYDYPPFIWVDSARIYANRGVALDDQCAECYKALGLSHAYQTKKSIDYYEKAIMINPNHWAALNNLLTQYFQVGEINLALQTLTKMEKVDRLAYFHNIGKSLQFLGMHSQSLPYFQRVVEIQNDADNNRRLLVNYYLLGDVSNADRVAMNSFSLTNDSSFLHVHKVWSLWLRERYKEAIEYGKLQPDNSSWLLLMALADSHHRIGEFEKANAYCQKGIERILSLYQGDINLVEHNDDLFHLSSLYAIAGSKEQALTLIEKSIKNNFFPSSFEEVAFDNIREEPRFKELIKLQEKKRAEAVALMDSYHFPKAEDL